MTQFSSVRILAVAKKEFFHILRDPFTLILALGLPVFLVTVFGFAIDFNTKNIHISVYDGDKTYSSRKLVDIFNSASYFKTKYVHSINEATADLETENAKAALILEPNFQKDLLKGQETLAQLILDGADNSSASVIMGYLSGIQQRAILELAPVRPTTPIVMKTRYLFNPELNSRWFVIPGLAVVVIAILSVLLTSLTLAREWENGSMELLLSSPIKPLELILGKIAPYSVLGLLAVLLIYFSARLVFGVPFVGNHLLFILATLIFLICCLAQGVLISIIARKQQVAMQMAIISGLLPSLLLSGFVFPIESMPKFFDYFTSLFAARWFMNLSREMFLNELNFGVILPQLTALIGIGIVFVAISLKKFKGDLEL